MQAHQLMTRIKPFTLTILLALSANTNAIAKDDLDASNDTAPYVAANETSINTDWMSATSAEFVRLDKTGNGLLLPYEASKDKAFNKKSFAQADADKDGYIDINEYTNFKAGQTPVNQSNANVNKHDNALSQKAVNQNYESSEVSTNESDRTVGAVLDDSVITTKVKAKILGTSQLKSLQINVETRDGEVVLSGAVDSLAAKTKAEQVVSQINGVKSVRNNLEVKG